MPDPRLRSRLDELGQLTDGWHDGDGAAPSAAALATARDIEQLTSPADRVVAFPTLEGGISLERYAAHGGWSTEISPDGALYTIDTRFNGPTTEQTPADPNGAWKSLKAFLGA
jgi:hypothetical protein